MLHAIYYISFTIYGILYAISYMWHRCLFDRAGSQFVVWCSLFVCLFVVCVFLQFVCKARLMSLRNNSNRAVLAATRYPRLRHPTAIKKQQQQVYDSGNADTRNPRLRSRGNSSKLRIPTTLQAPRLRYALPLWLCFCFFHLRLLLIWFATTCSVLMCPAIGKSGSS